MTSARDASTTLRFAIPYWTRWGQNVVVIVSHGNEGSRRHALICRQQDDDLLWEGELQVPSAAQDLEYSYAITGEAAEIEAEEMSKRSLALPEGLTDGSIIELRDSWQVGPLSTYPRTTPTAYGVLPSVCSHKEDLVSSPSPAV